MKAALTLMLVLFCCGTAKAEGIYRIEIGRDYQRYSDSDLRRRVWELERAVAQLQARVFQLETTTPAPATPDSWICTITAMGEEYTGTGGTKAVATVKAIDNCKAARKEGFFCKSPTCTQ